MTERFIIAKKSIMVFLIVLVLMIVFFVFSVTVFIGAILNGTTHTVLEKILFVALTGILLVVSLQCKKGIFASCRVIVNCSNKILEIHKLVGKKIIQKYSFSDIRSIMFFDEENHVVDYGKSWNKSLRITDKNNMDVFFSKVTNIYNYYKLLTLCSTFFEVDYIILNENNRFLYFNEPPRPSG